MHFYKQHFNILLCHHVHKYSMQKAKENPMLVTMNASNVDEKAIGKIKVENRFKFRGLCPLDLVVPHVRGNIHSH